MPQPTPYTPQTNFAADEAAVLSGRSTVRTANLDAEFDAIDVTVDDILTNIALIQRDDGKLRDRIVDFTSLSPEVLSYLTVSGAAIRGAWLTATAYALKDVVTNGTATYISTVAHTSGTFATDLAAGKWVTIFDASAGIFTPTATITSTTVQTAIIEVEQDSLVNIANAVAAALASLFTSAGATLVRWIQAGTGALTRTLESKARDRVDVRDFVDIVGTTTDISAGLTAALAAHDTVYIPAATVLIKNVDIGTHKRVICEGTVLKPASGALYIFKMTGFKPHLEGFYIDGGSDNITHGRTTNAAVIVDDATYPTILDGDFVNVFGGLLIKATAGETKGGKFAHLRFDTVDDRCIIVTKNVNTCTFHDIRGYVGTTPSGGLEIPKVGVIGLQIVSTSSTIASGGHQISNCDFEQCEIAFQFTDAQLSDVYDSFGDSCMKSGFQFTGACTGMTISDCFAGTCLLGVEIAGTSDVTVKGLETKFNGVVPPWGDPAAFYSAGSPFDVSIENTATGTIGNADWAGDRKLFVEATATVKFLMYDALYTNSETNLAAGTTTYLGPQGQQSGDGVSPWIAPRDGVALALTTQQAAAPGGAQTSVDTFRVETTDSSLVATTTGAAFGATASGAAFFTKGQRLQIKSVQSGTATATTHRYVLTVAYYGN